MSLKRLTRMMTLASINCLASSCVSIPRVSSQLWA
jgi:hypothetical protein